MMPLLPALLLAALAPCTTDEPALSVAPRSDLRPGRAVPLTLAFPCRVRAATPIQVAAANLAAPLPGLQGAYTVPAGEAEVTVKLALPAGAPAPEQSQPFGTLEVRFAGQRRRVELFWTQPLWGLADVHNHQFANLAFGGHVVWGSPAGRLSTSLGPCQYHPLKSFFSVFTHATHAGTAGAPAFAHWPAHDSWIHQGVHRDFLDRARQGGLRLMVMLAVNNKLLCKASLGHEPAYCDDMRAARRQICAAWALQREIDRDCGTPGCGWFRIATRATDARRYAREGKLAVVLGIEVDELFNCARPRRGNQCTREEVLRKVAAVHAMGVRHLFPIHFLSNGFGGAALSNPLTGPTTREYAVPCRGRGYEYVCNSVILDPSPLPAPGEHDWPFLRPWESTAGTDALVDPEAAAYAACDDREFLQPSPSDAELQPFPPNSVEHPQDALLATEPICTKHGLTPLGKDLLGEMKRRGMMIDVDHMSDRALSDTLGALGGYPVVASHTGFIDISKRAKRHEGNMTLEEVRALRDAGAILGIITNQQDPADPDAIVSPDPGRPLCPDSSAGFYAAFRYLDAQLHGLPIAFGTDMNGGINQPGPRQKPACHGPPPLPYPFPGLLPGAEPISAFQVPGRARAYDLNRDGLANIALLPDFAADVRLQLGNAGDVTPLLSAADGYISAWEFAERGR